MGLTRFQEAPATFDLVLLDMIMPVMNGRDCFAALKGLDPDVRVLLSSGFVDERELEEMRAEGLVGLLRKPYRSDALGRAVLKALSHGDEPRGP